MWARADDSDVLGMMGVDKNNRYVLFTATKLSYQRLVSLAMSECLAYGFVLVRKEEK
jgi:hypothetical protein